MKVKLQLVYAEKKNNKLFKVIDVVKVRLFYVIAPIINYKVSFANFLGVSENQRN